MSEPVTTFVVDGAAMAELMRGPHGDVMRFLTERATRLQLLARAQIKAQTKGSGKLAAGITKRPATIDGEPAVQVGAWNIPYAIFVHDGTKPHDIYPKTKKALAFFWPGSGFLDPSLSSGKASVGRPVKVGKGRKQSSRVVNTVVKHVHHPGTKAVHFLTDNLETAVFGG